MVMNNMDFARATHVKHNASYLTIHDFTNNLAKSKQILYFWTLQKHLIKYYTSDLVPSSSNMESGVRTLLIWINELVGLG